MASENIFELNLSQELPANILNVAIEQGENDDKKCDVVEELRNLIFEKGLFDPHRTDDEFLIKFLRARYWNAEVALRLLSNYYSFRKANSYLYLNVPCVDLLSLAEQDILTVTPYREQNGRRLMILRFGIWDPSKISVDDILKLTLIVLELGSLEPISQIAGGVGIFDLSGLSMSHVLHLTPSVAQKIIALIVTSSPLRTAAIHIVNQSWIFNIILKVFKPLLNAKMREKLFIHGNDMSSLHKHIEPTFLPKRYGGVKEDYSLSIWTENLKSNEKIKWELQELGYNCCENV